MEIYRASGIEKFRNTTIGNLSRNFYCAVSSHLDEEYSYYNAFYNFNTKKWYDYDDEDNSILDVKYFIELPDIGWFNDGIAKIKAKEAAKKSQDMQELAVLLKIIVDNINDDILTKNKIIKFLGKIDEYNKGCE